MNGDQRQDALAWLEDVAQPDAGVPEARHAGELIEAYETRENTVLGMLMARRPHDEIRDFLLAAEAGVQP